MRLFGSIIGMISALLLSVLSAAAMPTAPHQVEFFPQQETSVSEHTSAHFVARAPPFAPFNVVIAGAAVAEDGTSVVMRGQKAIAASLDFGGDLGAPNTGVPDGWRPVTGVGAQVSTPRGFTTYRTPDGDLVHVSPGGLQYGADPKFGNRVDHVLDHTVPNPNKPVHSVFNVQGDDALNLVDEAWARRGVPDPTDPYAFVVDMGRPIGTNGETNIRIVTTTPGGSAVRTAYPWP